MHYNNNLQVKHFALWGLLAFKPSTDDIREAAVLSIIGYLTELGATITAYNPEEMANVKVQISDKINYAENMYQVLIRCKRFDHCN